MTKKKKIHLKTYKGQYIPLTRRCLQGHNLTMLSPLGSKLFIYVLGMYSGFNNGDICLTWSLVKWHKWNSKASLYKAIKELLDAGWIVVTRRGGRNKCTLYALTPYWLDDCGGKLDSGFNKPTTSPIGGWEIGNGNI